MSAGQAIGPATYSSTASTTGDVTEILLTSGTSFTFSQALTGTLLTRTVMKTTSVWDAAVRVSVAVNGITLLSGVDLDSIDQLEAHDLIANPATVTVTLDAGAPTMGAATLYLFIQP